MTPPDGSNIIPFPHRAGGTGSFQLRVELILMPFPVWRQLLVPVRLNFWELHVALQDVMGWEDCHLHQFTVDDPRSGQRQRFGIPDDSGFHGVNDIMTGWEHPIAPYLVVGGHPLLYTYDFGDDWQHEVTLEAVLEDDDGELLPRCLDGAGTCPPEDSGGPPMCQNLMADAARQGFDPAKIVFDNPQQRWQRAFGRE